MFLVPLAVAVVFLAACWGFCRMTRDPERPSLARLADPRPLPGELHWCSSCGHRHYGRGPLNCRPAPFPADTGPLLLLSEAASASDAIGREVDEMIRQAEWKARRRR